MPNIYENNKRKCNLQLLEACQSQKHHLREFNDVIVLKKPDDAQIVKIQCAFLKQIPNNWALSLSLPPSLPLSLSLSLSVGVAYLMKTFYKGVA